MVDISVALGGGGVKGIAHIGVLNCLERSGFKIRAISGTSAGALAGALYAAGVSPVEMVDLFKSIKPGRMFGRTSTDGPSLLGMAGVAHVLETTLGERTFSDLEIPFACTAVDVHTGREIILRKGRVMDAVLASSAVPGVFPAVQMGSTLLIDGGVVDPVPVSLARELAPGMAVVAVVLSNIPEASTHLPEFHIPPPVPLPTPIREGIARLRIAQAMRIFIQSVDITSRALTELRLEVDKPEVIIRPAVEQFSLLEEVEPDVLVDLGVRAAHQSTAEIRRETSWTRRLTRRFQHASWPDSLALGKEM